MRQELESERLILEVLRPGHAAELFSVLQDPEMYRYIPGNPPVSEEELLERYTRQAAHSDAEGVWLNWILRLKADGRCIGYVQATIPASPPALLAYQVSSLHWGRGYAFEACSVALAHLAEAWMVSEIHAEVDTRNAASIRLAERLGFLRRDFRQGADFFKDALSDEIVFALRMDGKARGSTPF